MIYIILLAVVGLPFYTQWMNSNKRNQKRRKP